MLRRDRIAFKQKTAPASLSQVRRYRVQRETPPAKVFIKILLFDRMRTLESDFPGFVADVQLRDVALFREFDALFVGKFREAPEHATAALGSADGNHSLGPVSRGRES